MSKAAQKRLAGRASDPEKELIGLLKSFGYARRTLEVFSDFVEMGATAMSNAVDLRNRDAREARYLKIIGKYGKEEAARFPQMLGALTLALEQDQTTGGMRDVLGTVYMAMELGNEAAGQFFTPYEVSRLIAAMTLHDVRALVERKGFVTIHEPACGAGGMVIACSDVIREAGLNYQQAMHVSAIDVDARCVHMTYLQLALLHIPAVVIHGNSLSMEIYDHWRTPAHILGGWTHRLAIGQADAPQGALEAEPAHIGHDDRAIALPEPPALIGPAPAPAPTGSSRAPTLFDRAAQLGLF